MFEFILAATARSYYFLRRFMPSNVVIDAINTRRGLKWGVPTMLLAVSHTGSLRRTAQGWSKPVALVGSMCSCCCLFGMRSSFSLSGP